MVVIIIMLITSTVIHLHYSSAHHLMHNTQGAYTTTHQIN